MKNKGFTLVELIAVIVVLSLLITIAVPSVITISNKIKTNMFTEKISSIESSAKLYAQDMFSESVQASTTPIPIKIIQIRDLVKTGYLKKDDENCDINVNNSSCIKDPRDDSSLDNSLIEIYTKNKRLYASYMYKSTDATNQSICPSDKNCLISDGYVVYYKYDINRDGVVNIEDSIYLGQYMHGLITAIGNGYDKILYDVNNDGAVDSYDDDLISNIMLSLIDGEFDKAFWPINNDSSWQTFIINNSSLNNQGLYKEIRY